VGEKKWFPSHWYFGLVSLSSLSKLTVCQTSITYTGFVLTCELEIRSICIDELRNPKEMHDVVNCMSCVASGVAYC
jgi:hypothetical protein